MDDSYDPERLDETEDNDDDEFKTISNKEQVIILVDASEGMLEEYVERDDSGVTWQATYLEAAVRVAAQIMRHRIKFCPNDDIGLVFYSAANTKYGENQLQHVYEYVPLDVPDAETICLLEGFTMEVFQQLIGSHNKGSEANQATEDLRFGLWACRDILTKRSTKAAKSIMLFTNEECPTGEGQSSTRNRGLMMDRAEDLRSAGVSLDLYPIIALSREKHFDMSQFWAEMLKAAKGQEDDDDDLDGVMGQELLQRTMDQYGEVLSRMNRRRTPLGSLSWQITPMLQVAVKLYAMVLPISVPTITELGPGHKELKSTTAHISQETGALISKISHRRFELTSGKDRERYKPVVMDTSDLSSIKALRPRGIELLGFKPHACLAPYHQLRHADFLYPDEKKLQGSTAAFVALHEAMLQGGQVAIARLVRAEGRAPALVALVPQPEEISTEGVQLVPPGMHVIYLPFQEDLRFPEEDPLLTKHAAPPRATESQVAAAEELIAHLTLTEGTEEGDPPFIVRNPALALHWHVVEKTALANQVVYDDLGDSTLDLVSNRDQMLEGAPVKFGQAVYGETGGPPAAKGKKRKEPADASAADAYHQHDWRHLAGTETLLRKQTMDILKIYLKYHSLPVSGKKEDLVQRVREHVLSS